MGKFTNRRSYSSGDILADTANVIYFSDGEIRCNVTGNEKIYIVAAKTAISGNTSNVTILSRNDISNGSRKIFCHRYSDREIFFYGDDKRLEKEISTPVTEITFSHEVLISAVIPEIQRTYGNFNFRQTKINEYHYVIYTNEINTHLVVENSNGDFCIPTTEGIITKKTNGFYIPVRTGEVTKPNGEKKTIAINNSLESADIIITVEDCSFVSTRIQWSKENITVNNFTPFFNQIILKVTLDRGMYQGVAPSGICK